MASIATRTRARKSAAAILPTVGKASEEEKQETSEKKNTKKVKKSTNSIPKEAASVPKISSSECDVSLPSLSTTTAAGKDTHTEKLSSDTPNEDQVNSETKTVKEVEKKQNDSGQDSDQKSNKKHNDQNEQSHNLSNKSEAQTGRQKKRKVPDTFVVKPLDAKEQKELAKAVFSIYKSESHSTSKPKGNPVSGRKWKTEQTARFSDVKKDKPLRSSWEKKMKAKAEKKSIKMYEKQLQEARALEIQKKKERKADKLKRKLENERKSEVVQTIKNTAKLKRMKKKQLRQIEKR